MKNLKLISINIFGILLLFISCKVQKNANAANYQIPKIENHNKGMLEIRVAPFGLNANRITVGQIKTDGTIHFNWAEIDLNAIDDSDFYMSSIKRVVGMSFCNEKQIEEISKITKAVEIELSLYKNDQYIGLLYPATQKKIQDNGSLNRNTQLILGSYLSWYYSDSAGNFKAMCTVNMKMENTYDFKEVTNYDIRLKKGWNIIKHTLLEREDWKNESQQGSLPKTSAKITISDIPDNIVWYSKYFGE